MEGAADHRFATCMSVYGNRETPGKTPGRKKLDRNLLVGVVSY